MRTKEDCNEVRPHAPDMEDGTTAVGHLDRSGPQRGALETEAPDFVKVTGRHPTSHLSSAHQQQQRAAKEGVML